MHISAVTLDDLLCKVAAQINEYGERIRPGKGAATELTSVMLQLTNPRARLSRARTRGKPFSCLGELCWYLASSAELAFMTYYIPDYANYAEGDPVFGAYGPRLFNWKGVDQIANVIKTLLARRDSRRAVVQIFDATDLAKDHQEIPCTCTLQFFVRSERLHMLTNMRSNDVHSGLAHDIFSFTMLQEIVARSVSVELGSYSHSVGSLHLYDEDLKAAIALTHDRAPPTSARFYEMPRMPTGNPWPSIKVLQTAERDLRIRGAVDDSVFDAVDPYWADLIRLLKIFRAHKNGDDDVVKGISGRFNSTVYNQFMGT